MLILGIETSCDETAAAVVADGVQVLSSAVFSQIVSHQPYGGVVPEIAARCHVEVLPGVVAQALEEAGIKAEALDAVAVTRGPGLATALLIGVTSARALALRLNKPLIGVHHHEGHLHSVFLGGSFKPVYPMVSLVVSGGHTSLVLTRGPGHYHLLGQTLDDAAGEALDKGASLLGLGYPGGPAIEKAAMGGDPAFIKFPRAVASKGGAKYGMELPFSFSGLKTSLLYKVKELGPEGLAAHLSSVAASYQEAVMDALAEKSGQALASTHACALACVGGVARNKRLRQKLLALSVRCHIPLMMAAPDFCTDNAAMIAGVAFTRFQHPDSVVLDVDPQWALTSLKPENRSYAH